MTENDEQLLSIREEADCIDEALAAIVDRWLLGLRVCANRSRLMDNYIFGDASNIISAVASWRARVDGILRLVDWTMLPRRKFRDSKCGALQNLLPNNQTWSCLSFWRLAQVLGLEFFPLFFSLGPYCKKWECSNCSKAWCVIEQILLQVELVNPRDNVCQSQKHRTW